MLFFSLSTPQLVDQTATLAPLCLMVEEQVNREGAAAHRMQNDLHFKSSLILPCSFLSKVIQIWAREVRKTESLHQVHCCLNINAYCKGGTKQSIAPFHPAQIFFLEWRGGPAISGRYCKPSWSGRSFCVWCLPKAEEYSNQAHKLSSQVCVVIAHLCNLGQDT